MTLERVVSVTTFTNDNQVTTTQGRQTFIDEDKGYSTVPSNPKSKSSPSKRSQEAIDRSGSHQCLLKTPTSKAISNTAATSTSQSKHFHQKISHARSTPVCNSHFQSSSSINQTPLDIRNNNHLHMTSCSKSRYKKHEKSSKSRGFALDFPKVQKAQSESALCDNKRNNFSTPSRQDCNGNLTQSSRNVRYHSCSSPESPKPSNACALSYVFPWSQKNNRRRRHRSPPSEDRHYNRRDSTPNIRTTRLKSCSTSIHSTKASQGDLFRSATSSHFGPDSSCPLSPKSAPGITSFHFPSGKEESSQHRSLHHYKDRSRSEHRQKHKSSTTTVVRDKSEDAFREPRREGCSEDFDAQQSQGESRKSRGSSNRVYRSRSDHSSNPREIRAASSSGASGRAKCHHRPSRADQEEGSLCQNTESSSDSRSGSGKSEHLEPQVTFGRYSHPEADIKVISDAEDFEYRPTDMKGPLHLSFCGCGFLGMYHLGVVSTLIQRAPTLLDRVEKFAGASAGALMAALLVTSRDKVEESVVHFHTLSKEIRGKPLGALTPGYSLAKSLRYMLDDVLPEYAHLDASGRLFVSVTNGSTKKNEVLSEFSSREELLEVLVASCYVPIYAGSKLPTVRGKRYMDGGLTNNLLMFDSGRTITVSPFDGKSDVGPKTGHEASKKAHFINLQNQNLQMNMQNVRRGAHAFFPPRKPILQDYYDKGRKDASRFLIKEGLYEIQLQQHTESVVYESSV